MIRTVQQQPIHMLRISRLLRSILSLTTIIRLKLKIKIPADSKPDLQLKRDSRATIRKLTYATWGSKQNSPHVTVCLHIHDMMTFDRAFWLIGSVSWCASTVHLRKLLNRASKNSKAIQRSLNYTEINKSVGRACSQAVS